MEELITLSLRLDGTRLQLPAVEKVNGVSIYGEAHPQLMRLAVQYDSSQTPNVCCELQLTIPQAQTLLTYLYPALQRIGALPPPRPKPSR